LIRIEWFDGQAGSYDSPRLVRPGPVKSVDWPLLRLAKFLENGGTLEVVQRIAVPADSRTTKLYDRRGQKVLLEDMEGIWY
jgi:hypothetical protein